jgi:hypothetical protein
MANRSDFMRATLPRSIKRMIALMGCDSSEQRRMWIDAHAHARRVKIRSNSSPAGRSTDLGE